MKFKIHFNLKKPISVGFLVLARLPSPGGTKILSILILAGDATNIPDIRRERSQRLVFLYETASLGLISESTNVDNFTFSYSVELLKVNVSEY